MSEQKKKFLGFGDQKPIEKLIEKPVEASSKGTFAALKLIVPKTDSAPRLSSVSSVSSQASKDDNNFLQSIAPVKDFHKVSNSINREAVPNGLFKTGTSKKIYDVLYLLTRGAINPTRKVNIKKSELMKKCNIGARVTLDAGVIHLQNVGLIKLGVVGGKHVGNEFEVFLPEEIEALSLSRQSSQPRLSSHAYFLDSLDCLESRQSRQAQTIENKDTSGFPKTYIKTEDNNDDDANAAFSEFAKIFNETNKELTGKEINRSDAAALKEIAELLVAEIHAARLKTKSISKPVAFLAKHLRTRLLSPNLDFKTSKAKPDTVGKSGEQTPNLIDLSNYSVEELAALEKDFCLKCGKAHDECKCKS